MVDIIRRIGCGNIKDAMAELQNEIAKRPKAIWDLMVSHDDNCPCLSGAVFLDCNCSPDITATKICDIEERPTND